MSPEIYYYIEYASSFVFVRFLSIFTSFGCSIRELTEESIYVRCAMLWCVVLPGYGALRYNTSVSFKYFVCQSTKETRPKGFYAVLSYVICRLILSLFPSFNLLS